jgi:transposase
MFIRTVTKSNGKGSKKYQCHQLVESIRTEKGVNQKLLLCLGRLQLPKEHWPRLVARMKAIIHNQQSFFVERADIEKLAQKYAQLFIEKHGLDNSIDNYQTVDVQSLENHRVRFVGGEYLGAAFFKKLKLAECLQGCGFTQRQIEIAMLLIIGRLVHPGSERHLFDWAQNISGLDELIKTDFSQLSLNSLYRVSDLLYEHKAEIESHLRIRENDLFSLNETIILYDLTNTYFEGRAACNSKAKFGRSKEKRSDCKLVALGLVIDSRGFPKASQVFSGNQSEPETLLDMVETLRQKDPANTQKPTVVIDAGIATEENLEKLKEQHYHYIAVSRKKIEPPASDDCIVIKQTKQNKVEAKRISGENEIFLYCKSSLKQQKERSMQGRLQQNFQEQLTHIAKSIRKKGATKRYDKVLERIGRLKEKYKQIARFYQIHVEEKDALASRITWKYLQEQSDQRFSGSYFLRTDRLDLSEKEIWSIYIMLTQLEDSFRTLKTDLQLRPVFHQKENRSDAHIFITLLAYHLLHSIRSSLKEKGIHLSWRKIRDRMSTHSRLTNRLKTKNGNLLFIRKCSEPEEFHKTIYNALNLDNNPCKTKKYRIKICSDP